MNLNFFVLKQAAIFTLFNSWEVFLKFKFLVKIRGLRPFKGKYFYTTSFPYMSLHKFGCILCYVLSQFSYFIGTLTWPQNLRPEWFVSKGLAVQILWFRHSPSHHSPSLPSMVIAYKLYYYAFPALLSTFFVLYYRRYSYKKNCVKIIILNLKKNHNEIFHL